MRWPGRRRAPRLALPGLLEAFAEAYPRAEFVEVGANDGEQHDHLRPHVLGRQWTGVMVEPVPYVFERLERNYRDVPRVTLANVAVAERDGELPFYFLRDAPAAERAELPSWYDGIGSFSREAVLSHAPQMPDIEERLVERSVPALTFESLCERHGIAGPDLLVIDTEGHDAAIVRSIDLRRRRPRMLVYEHFHLTPDDRAEARAHVRAAGYEVLEEGFDTIALLPEEDRLTRRFRRARPGVPPVTKADETPDLPLHDTSVPLPAGAEEALRPDHPRLAELRAAYAACDVPARVASRWSEERVAGFLDLRFFRGETLITWHYRDDPDATRGRYEAMLRHAAARDELGLLDRLAEDGLFGCWTFDIDGRRVSRDLLDSVNELSFLERSLGLSGRDGLRVLDVGAGYGRLAHRACSALPGIADWCCVDAVAESTFLCEYYLGFRGVAPPARVVGLPDVGTLEPGSFDLAVNVHSFSECSLVAIEWWLEQLARLRVEHLLVVPNDGEALLSLEPDGTRRDFGPLVERAGFARTATEPVWDVPGLDDRFHLFARR
jgi:putative sugar O-methyltransferase